MHDWPFLERPNPGIDQVQSAAFSLVFLKQITAVLKIDMAVQFSHTLVDVMLFVSQLVIYKPIFLNLK